VLRCTYAVKCDYVELSSQWFEKNKYGWLIGMRCIENVYFGV